MRILLLAPLLCLISFYSSAQTTATKTYNPGSSTSIDGCGTYCSILPGVSFTTLDFTPGSTITDVNVSITWAKTDGTCTSPGIGNSFHAETSFRMDSPSGDQVILAPPATWSGNATISAVTTVFSQSGSAIPSGTPVSGTFLPNTGNLNDNQTDTPFGTWTLRAGDNGTGDPLCVAEYSVEITVVDSLQAGASVDNNISCNGGTNGQASSTPAGGSGSYTYSWSNGATTATISGLAAGTYTVTVTDALGVTSVEAITVTQPTVLVASSVVDNNISCNGFSDGGATASATGGTGAYTYSWSNGATSASITGVVAGSYSVTITDANGCTDSASVTITQPTALSVSIGSVTHVSCNGLTDGSATATATGGSTPYTYAWSNGGTNATATGLAAGTYTITITDANGCTGTNSATITEPVAVSVSISSVTNVSCNGGNDGSATATATGGSTPYTYAWSNGGTNATATGLAAGTYTITITDANGCTGTNSATITEPVAVSVSISSVTNVSCNGGNDGSATATATGGSTPYTYAWSNGATNATATGLAAGTYTITITDANGCTGTNSTTITEPTVLSASIGSVTNVSCNGGSDGSATASATGGTSPYNYLWSNGANTAAISGLAAGTYTVTVTDNNGCTDTATVSITEPTAITTSIGAIVNVSCNGGNDGSANASVTGGTSPYSYSWSNGGTTASVTGLSAGTYTVTITDNNGCTNTDSVSIAEPLVITVSIPNLTNVSCNGGSNGTATASATGGSSPYTYLWSSGSTMATATALAAGTHTVTITDNNGCTAVENTTISEPAVLTITLDSVIDVTCEGGSDGSVSAFANGGTSPYNYSWSNGGSGAGINSLTAGSYDVTVTDDNGCTASTSGTVGTGSPLPSPNLGNDTTTANGDSLVLFPGSFPSYLWQDGSMDSTFTAAVSGTYYVEVTDTNGCSGSDTIIVNIWPLGIKVSGLKAELRVYPNPAKDEINIELSNMPNGEVSFFLIDIEGSEVSDKTVTISNSTFNDKLEVSQLPSGVYFLRIVSANGSLTHRVIVE